MTNTTRSPLRVTSPNYPPTNHPMVPQNQSGIHGSHLGGVSLRPGSLSDAWGMDVITALFRGVASIENAPGGCPGAFSLALVRLWRVRAITQGS
jgi:hypothetical protein